MKPDPESIKEVFSQALLKKGPAEREQYLAAACEGQPELRQQVESLLQAHEQSGAFLGQTMKLTASNFVAETTGSMIGRYKVLQQIGEGGCGVVYMAEQQEPVRRRVALKVIKLGMDTRQVIARFEAERQALALMDHPNIAKVFDAGATESGRPYFVMELVKGIPITRYCDENNLNTVTRLGLFVQVCQAIQHAHQKGIIHRDIKPSNVLVADHDGVPVPKIIDFGIAKATTDQPLTDKTLFTAFEQFIGTPAYMSPEQAKLSGLDIDTRSDIYSLGVMLYELLTGKTPFEGKRLLEAGLDEIRRIIREEEPPRPSTRLHTLDAAEQTTVAKHRQSDAPKLVHTIRGDLDWIAMKALEKDRSRRYETANGLAMDVQRYLSHEAIVARPPSNLYRFGKLVRRNRRTLINATAVLSLVVVTVLWAGPPIKARLKEHQARVALERLVLQPPPWKDGEEMQLDAKTAGVKVGTYRYAILGGQTNGQKTWRLLNYSPGQIQTPAVVEAQADTFKPIHSLIELGENVADTTYRSDHAEVKSSGQAEATKVALTGPMFDNEEFFQLVRRLPLAPGYKIPLRLCRLGSVSICEVEVSGVETVTVPQGTFPCFRLKPFDGQTYWYSTDPHHYLVKFEAKGVVAELSGVRESTDIALQPPPWQDGEEMQLDIKTAGVKVGTYRYSVRAGETNGQKIWRMLDYFPGGPHMLVEAQADTFKPIHSVAKPGANVVDIIYRPDHAEVKSSAEADVRKVALDGPAFDNEEFYQLVRRLPLAPGYKIRLPLFGGGASVVIWELEVSGLETVTVPAGTYPCFKLKPFAEQTYWYSTDPHRYLVKWEVGGVVAELSAVSQSPDIVLQPAPWLDGEEMQLDIKSQGTMVGTYRYRYSVRAGETNGQKIWRLRNYAPGQAYAPRLVEAQADTFAPIHSRIEMGNTVVDKTYRSGHVEVTSSSGAEVRKVALDGPVFDEEEFNQLVRRLPLAPGYKISLPLLGRLGSGDMWEVEVSGLETVTVPAGTFECFRLKPFYGQTLWYSTDPHHYFVKSEGSDSLVELSAVRDSTDSAWRFPEGHRDEVIKLREAALAQFKRVNGPQSPETFKAMDNLATSYDLSGRQDDAIKLREEVLALRRKALGPEQPETLGAMYNLADSYCSAGRVVEATALLGNACGLNPSNTLESLTLATWQRWFGQDADYEATRLRLLQEAEGTDQAGTADRAAKAYCLRPSTDAAALAKSLALAQRAVELRKGPWDQLALGLAEYRNLQFAAAERTLADAEQSAGGILAISGTARLFRAMSLFQENRPEEARKLFNQAEMEMPPLPKDEHQPLVDGSLADRDMLIWWLAYKEARSLLTEPAAAKP
jgi:serine/threonine protein kinase/tetratricopeptide (TPR) repeat protein